MVASGSRTMIACCLSSSANPQWPKHRGVSVRLGSFSTELSWPRHVRVTPGRDRWVDKAHRNPELTEQTIWEV
jgi:hypothetical protein